MKLRIIFMLIVIMLTMVGCRGLKYTKVEVNNEMFMNEVSNSNVNDVQNDNEIHEDSITVDKHTVKGEKIENDLEEEIERVNEYLVARTFDGTTILINITKALNGETSILETSQIESKYFLDKKLDDYNFRKISADGQYAYLTHGTGRLNPTELDKSKKIIYDFLEKTFVSFELNATLISGDLSKYYKYSDEGFAEIYDIKTDNKLTLKNMQGGWSAKIVSTDNKYIAGVAYENENCFLIIFDIENDVVSEKIFLGTLNLEEFRIPIWISQWHSNGEIFFNFEHSAYKYDFKSRKIIYIGKYMFYPFLTYDEKNIVYARLQSDPSEWPVAHLSDYGEIGIYIRNIETGKDTQILKDSDYGTEDMQFEYLITTEVIYEEKE